MKRTSTGLKTLGRLEAICMTEKMRVILLSFACCNPKLAVHDQQYLRIIQEALKRTGQEAQSTWCMSPKR